MNPDLERLRARIDELDAATIHLLAERYRLVADLAKVKSEAGIPEEDTEREAHLRRAHEKAARLEAVDPDIVARVFAVVVAESKRLQGRVNGKG